MRHFIKAVFRPTANRHYTNKKKSQLLYVLEFLPVASICLYCAVSIDSFFWIVLAAVVLYGVIYYLLFDAFGDRLSWKLLWSRFYSDEATSCTAADNTLKAFKQNSTPKNYEALQKHSKLK